MYKDIKMLTNKLINLHQPIQLQQGTNKSKVVKYPLLCQPETPVQRYYIAAIQGVLHNNIIMQLVHVCIIHYLSVQLGYRCVVISGGILLSGVACTFLHEAGTMHRVLIEEVLCSLSHYPLCTQNYTHYNNLNSHCFF